jgi:hypothetical protein
MNSTTDLLASSRVRRDESRALVRATRQILAASTRRLARSGHRLLVSHELLASLGRARRLCGGSDAAVGPRRVERQKAFDSSDQVMFLGASKELLHLASYQARIAGGSAPVGSRSAPATPPSR